MNKMHIAPGVEPKALCGSNSKYVSSYGPDHVNIQASDINQPIFWCRRCLVLYYGKANQGGSK